MISSSDIYVAFSEEFWNISFPLEVQVQQISREKVSASDTLQNKIEYSLFKEKKKEKT